jgi:superfamily II DNA or RNA helicase
LCGVYAILCGVYAILCGVYAILCDVNVKLLDNANSIDYNDLNYVTLDECHSVSAPVLYSLLYKIRYTFKKEIIGFSATPLRPKSESKLITIFGADNKLNIISTYEVQVTLCLFCS